MKPTVSPPAPRRPTAAWLEARAAALKALADCIQACLAGAEACLDQENPARVRGCIRTTLNCATVCEAAVQVLHRQDRLLDHSVHDLLHACVTTCDDCHHEARQQAARVPACGACATACLACRDDCRRLLDVSSPFDALADSAAWPELGLPGEPVAASAIEAGVGP
ncbi:MAG TPA: hypothetical protein VL200_06670 [Lacunisphaera sp.]|nr:hypothetical protein [Lacunisphaera sp.]